MNVISVLFQPESYFVPFLNDLINLYISHNKCRIDMMNRKQSIILTMLLILYLALYNIQQTAIKNKKPRNKSEASYFVSYR